MAPEWLRLVVALVCAVSAVAILRRRLAPSAATALLACAFLLVPAGATDTASAPRFAASLIATPMAPMCGAVAGLWWPARPLRRRLLALGFAALGAALVAGLLHAASFDPGSTGCSLCPDNLLAVPPAQGLAAPSDRIAAVLLGVTGLVVAVVAAGRWWRSGSLDRRVAWPMLFGSAGVAAMMATDAVHLLTRPRDLFDYWAGPIWNAQLVLLALVAVGGWWRLSLPRRTADRVARKVLAATPDVATLVGSLAREIGDPDLVVTYRRLDGTRIDVDGRPAAALAGRAVLRLTRDGATYAELWHAARVESQSDVLRATVDSSGLALEYVAAQARLRAETLDAQAARRRVVATADAERGRLERDLHDGAQQGLITVSLQLTAAAARSAPAAVARAQEEITLALQDLRTLAHGLFPVSLTEAGLLAALRELGDHTLVPLVVDGAAFSPMGAEVDMAFYNLVVDVASATPEASGAVVRVALEGGDGSPARVRVSATPADPDRARLLLVRAEDRVAALGGTLSVVATEDALVVEGEVPCGS